MATAQAVRAKSNQKITLRLECDFFLNVLAMLMMYHDKSDKSSHKSCKIGKRWFCQPIIHDIVIGMILKARLLTIVSYLIIKKTSRH